MTGEEMRQVRERLGMNQTQFAELVSRHKNMIARYERDELPIPAIVEKLVRLMTARAKKGRGSAT